MMPLAFDFTSQPCVLAMTGAVTLELSVDSSNETDACAGLYLGASS